MAKLNSLGNNLFNLNSFNDLKKDQTNIKIFKNSSFDSNFNSCSSKSEGFSNARVRLQGRTTKGEGCYPKLSAILRAIRSIRLNRDEWKLIKYINLMEKKLSILSPSPKRNACEGVQRSPLVLRTKIVAPPLEKNLSPKEERVLWSEEKERKNFYIKQRSYNKIFSYNNIISKNILLRNMKYNFLKSTLSSILKTKIRRISEVLEDKPNKNYVLYSYLKNCIFTPTHSLGSEGIRGSFATEGGVLGRSKLSLNKYKGRKLGSFINYNKIIGFNFNSNFYQVLPNCLAPFALTYGSSPKNSLLWTSVATKGARGSKKIAMGGVASPLGGRLREKDSPSPMRKSLRRGVLSDEGRWSCNRYIKDTYKLLFYLFKSMYCLISKPVLKYTNDKVTIQLFYYLNIPKKKIFRLFSISYIKSIKKKWLAQSATAHSTFGTKIGRGNTKLNIRWKIRKAISRLKNKIITSSSSFGVQSDPKSYSLSLGSTPPLGRDGVVRKDSLALANPKERGKNLLFLLRKFNLTKVYQKKFKLICAILSKKFNKPVELQLIRLHHPYHDSNILVNLLSLNIKNKRKKARVAIQKIFNKKPVKNLNDPNLKNSALLTAESLARGAKVTGKIIPAFLSGLNIKIAGRLMGEPIIPRITTKIFGKGASATGKVNYLDVARITKKNRKGAYTIKITSGQNFF